jgi:hypothetical protein
MTKQEWKALEEIWGAESLDAAGAAYREHSDVHPKDKSLDKKFRGLFDEALKKRKTKVAIPIKLALAIALRSGTGRSGYRRKTAVARDAAHDADDEAASIYLLIDRKGLTAARARYAEVRRKPYNDPTTDAEIEECFLEWMSEPVPLRIRPHQILALMLRPRLVKVSPRARGSDL